MTTIRQQDNHPTTLSQHHTPLAIIQPGRKITVHTLDAFANQLSPEQPDLSRIAQRPHINPVTGPILIENAQPGDALHIHIHDIQPDRDYAVTALVPKFGGLTTTHQTALLHDPLPPSVRFMPINNNRVHFSDTIALPYQPMIGTIGTAPPLEAISSLVPDHFGGNLDCTDVCPGNILILPVLVPGACLFLGDAHATQGDGEVSGVAAEMPARITLTVNLHKNAAPTWPRIQSPTQLITIGAARPLEDAARIAWCELIHWMTADYNFNPLDAYQLLGQVGRMKVGNMVDPNYTMLASIDRQYLAPR